LALKSDTLGDDQAKRYTDIVLGKSRSGGFLAFDVAEVLVFAGALSDARRRQVAAAIAPVHGEPCKILKLDKTQRPARPEAT
jgi:hypothetical protein